MAGAQFRRAVQRFVRWRPVGFDGLLFVYAARSPTHVCGHVFRATASAVRTRKRSVRSIRVRLRLASPCCRAASHQTPDPNNIFLIPSRPRHRAQHAVPTAFVIGRALPVSSTIRPTHALNRAWKSPSLSAGCRTRSSGAKLRTIGTLPNRRLFDERQHSFSLFFVVV